MHRVYSESFLTYGNIKFDEGTALCNFNGTYAYWAPDQRKCRISVCAGRFLHRSVDRFARKSQVKGKGDINNREFDNLMWRAGLKLGSILVSLSSLKAAFGLFFYTRTRPKVSMISTSFSLLIGFEM